MARLDTETTWIFDSDNKMWFIEYDDILSIVLPVESLKKNKNFSSNL